MNRRRRELIQLALGSPAEPKPEDALLLLLDAVTAEAKRLGDDTATIGLACRLEALGMFVSEFMTVSWAEGVPNGGAQ